MDKSIVSFLTHGVQPSTNASPGMGNYSSPPTGNG